MATLVSSFLSHGSDTIVAMVMRSICTLWSFRVGGSLNLNQTIEDGLRTEALQAYRQGVFVFLDIAYFHDSFRSFPRNETEFKDGGVVLERPFPKNAGALVVRPDVKHRSVFGVAPY